MATYLDVVHRGHTSLAGDIGNHADLPREGLEMFNSNPPDWSYLQRQLLVINVDTAEFKYARYVLDVIVN